jgi:hypothetical protein
VSRALLFDEQLTEALCNLLQNAFPSAKAVGPSLPRLSLCHSRVGHDAHLP